MAQRPLNPTAAALLGLLANADLSGYDLHQAARQVIGDFWNLTRSQVYRELDALSERGLAGQEGPRARRPFHLTNTGRAQFARWVATPPALESIRFPLLLSLTFGQWLGTRTALAFAEQHRPEHQARLEGYLAILADLKDAPGEQAAYGRARLGFGVAYEQAVLAWMDQLPDLLRGARPDPDPDLLPPHRSRPAD